jgi:hypothetical protein
MLHLKIVSCETHKKFVIPFFLQHKLQSRKYLDLLIFNDMCNFRKSI